MGYNYEFKNNENVIKDKTEFKEILLWKIVEFLQSSLPDKRPIQINIEKDR